MLVTNFDCLVCCCEHLYFSTSIACNRLLHRSVAFHWADFDIELDLSILVFEVEGALLHSFRHSFIASCWIHAEQTSMPFSFTPSLERNMQSVTFLPSRNSFQGASQAECLCRCGRAIAGLDHVPGTPGTPKRGDGSLGQVRLVRHEFA